MKKVLKFFVAFIVTLALLGVIGSSCSSTQGSSGKTDSDAIVAAENYVKNDLKSPASAKFSNEQAKQDSEGNWIVSGLVDSQNAFGAMLRSSFILKLDKNDNLISNVDLQQQ